MVKQPCFCSTRYIYELKTHYTSTWCDLSWKNTHALSKIVVLFTAWSYGELNRYSLNPMTKLKNGKSPLNQQPALIQPFL